VGPDHHVGPVSFMERFIMGVKIAMGFPPGDGFFPNYPTQFVYFLVGDYWIVAHIYMNLH
jgi:hypothetical protein